MCNECIDSVFLQNYFSNKVAIIQLYKSQSLNSFSLFRGHIIPRKQEKCSDGKCFYWCRRRREGTRGQRPLCEGFGMHVLNTVHAVILLNAREIKSVSLTCHFGNGALALTFHCFESFIISNPIKL